MLFKPLALSLLLVASYICCSRSLRLDDPTYISGLDEFGKNTSALIEHRGFIAESHRVEPAFGYNLSLVRILNPKINDGLSGVAGKEPILFIHGIMESGKSFIINSIGAKPRDLSSCIAGQYSLNELVELLKDDPATNSLPLLMSNFGHEVWILSRRSTIESQKTSGRVFNPLSTPVAAMIAEVKQLFINECLKFKRDAHFEARYQLDVIKNLTNGLLEHELRLIDFAGKMSNQYWNFSLDNQAKYDIPKVIDYIIEISNRSRISIVGHSLGGALPLMTMSEKPEYSKKIATAILFAPAVHLGDSFIDNPVVQVVASLEPALNRYFGPVSPTMLVPVLQSALAAVCQVGLINDHFCLSVMEAVFGYSGQQLRMLPGFYSGLLDVTGSHELVQLIQSIKTGFMHYFDYRDPLENLLMYGAESAPLYNLTRIRNTRLAIWWGNTDPLVTQADTRLLIKSLQAPVEIYSINETGIHFNHIAFLLHKNVSTLLNIPALRCLESISPTNYPSVSN